MTNLQLAKRAGDLHDRRTGTGRYTIRDPRAYGESDCAWEHGNELRLQWELSCITSISALFGLLLDVIDTSIEAGTGRTWMAVEKVLWVRQITIQTWGTILWTWLVLWMMRGRGCTTYRVHGTSWPGNGYDRISTIACAAPGNAEVEATVVVIEVRLC